MSDAVIRLSDRRAAASSATLADALSLAKVGIVKMVAITAGVGFLLGALHRAWPGGATQLIVAGLCAVAGVALAAAGANVLNQVLERDRDALMSRTADRPIPSGRFDAGSAGAFGALLTVLGLLALLTVVGPLAAAITLATSVLYLFVYTPMKPLTPWSLHVGAIPGALPPLIGYTAAVPELDALTHAAAWLPVAMVAAWQIPHFGAIAWRHRADYERGGFKVLSVVDRSGGRLARSAVVWTIVLTGVSAAALAVEPSIAGVPYAIATALVSAVMLSAALRFARSRSDADAKRLFLASILFLPVALVMLSADAARLGLTG